MLDIENHSCVRFFNECNSKGHYVNITGSITGCIAEIGYKHKAGQILNLNSKCNTLGTAKHELLHALGFFHQHSSMNRDDYIKINEANINPVNVKYFTSKVEKKYATDFGYMYDYDSIMHYAPRAASVNGLPTITALKDGAKNMGQRKDLSTIDVFKLNKLYKCGANIFKKRKQSTENNYNSFIFLLKFIDDRHSKV